ncbi:hypothetical protein TRAPUB_14039 [Trametes pubescens]|uniref:Uncharacterized protein n=1 Tax=Trametes pubescens TaxID=154538 RepID=A0A1M2VPE6_TRAPU|nr:hypothetical protein TRAPUB_14039 [Trametes pubescens]
MGQPMGECSLAVNHSVTHKSRYVFDPCGVQPCDGITLRKPSEFVRSPHVFQKHEALVGVTHVQRDVPSGAGVWKRALPFIMRACDEKFAAGGALADGELEPGPVHIKRPFKDIARVVQGGPGVLVKLSTQSHLLCEGRVVRDVFRRRVYAPVGGRRLREIAKEVDEVRGVLGAVDVSGESDASVVHSEDAGTVTKEQDCIAEFPVLAAKCVLHAPKHSVRYAFAVGFQFGVI